MAEKKKRAFRTVEEIFKIYLPGCKPDRRKPLGQNRFGDGEELAADLLAEFKEGMRKPASMAN